MHEGGRGFGGCEGGGEDGGEKRNKKQDGRSRGGAPVFTDRSPQRLGPGEVVRIGPRRDPVQQRRERGPRIDLGQRYEVVPGGLGVDDGALALDEGEPRVVARRAVDVLVQEVDVLVDEGLRREEDFGNRRHGEDLDAVREDGRRAEPRVGARREGAEDADDAVVVGEGGRVDGRVLGHVVVRLRGADLEREQHARPVDELDVAERQRQEVGAVVGVDRLRRGLLRFALAHEEDARGPRVAVVEVLVARAGEGRALDARFRQGGAFAGIRDVVQ
mmetsp:Transcript_11545/g.46725  ORF Transcript_11545/g.46725 Transcript_11545/m.46725 type:complete len:274 (+) Transcript_11545:232-1053(+)